MTDGGTLDDVYFEWLYQEIGSVRNRNPERTYWELCKKLYMTEFNWFVPNDDNRVEDGKELRLQFLDSAGLYEDEVDRDWLNLECSFLEMLIALARLAAFESDGSSVEWFWRFMHNLELDRYSDAIYEVAIDEEVAEVLDRLNRRTYSADGVGGLFPLRNAIHDQRTIELWYQLSSYLQEGLYVNTRPNW